MKNIIYIVFIAIMAFAIHSFMNPSADFKADEKEGIKFHRGSWEQALELARKENKLVFLDLYAVWCGPCKKLKNKTFANKHVGAYFNSKFINVSLDGETGEGEMLANKYNITAYPSLFFIDKEGNVISRTEGYYDADEILSFGRSVLK